MDPNQTPPTTTTTITGEEEIIVVNNTVSTPLIDDNESTSPLIDNNNHDEPPIINSPTTNSSPIIDQENVITTNHNNNNINNNNIQQVVAAEVLVEEKETRKSVSILLEPTNIITFENSHHHHHSSEEVEQETPTTTTTTTTTRVRERRISRRIVVNTNFQPLTSTTTSTTNINSSSSNTTTTTTPPIHSVDIFDDSENDDTSSTTCCSSDDDVDEVDPDGMGSTHVKDGYFEDSDSLKASDILSIVKSSTTTDQSSTTDGILINNGSSILKVNEAVNYYPSINEMNNHNNNGGGGGGEKSQPKLYSSIIFESKHDQKRIHTFESIVSNYKDYVTRNPNQFRKLIREGIPTKELLKTLWKRMVGSEELSNKYSGLYKKLTMHDDTLEDDVHKIMKDVHRTYPQYEFFSEKEGPGQMSLIRILKAYCHFDKQTGYCQGMAFICGFALMNLEDEEDTFWFFVQIMNNSKHGLKDIFAEGLPRLRLVMFMVSELIKLRLPDIHKHLEENYILPEMYASSILMTLCTNRFSFAASQRIWSIFLNEGWKMLIRLMAGLVKLSKKEIMGANATEVTTKLYHTAEHVDIDIILKYSFSVRLTSRLMDNLTLKYEEQELNDEEKKAAQQSRENLRKLSQLSLLGNSSSTSSLSSSTGESTTPRSGRSFSVSSIFAKISNLLGLLDSREDDAAMFKKNLT